MNDRPSTDRTTGKRQRLVLSSEWIARLRAVAGQQGISGHEFLRNAAMAAIAAAEKKLEKKR